MNLNNFQFIKKNSNRCQNLQSSDSFLNLVIIIHSSVRNFRHRQIIRETWGRINTIDFNEQQKANINYVFILGATNSTKLQNHVNEESEIYHDIVQSNFIDHYQNLTYKHVSGLRWAIEFCHQVDFIIKLDDDAYLNLYTVIESLINYKNHLITNDTLRIKNLLACSLFPSDTKPKRQGKWSLSLESYPDNKFPSYCSGVGYIITPDLAFDLYEAAQNAHTFIPFISIDDVYITGLLMETLKPTIRPVPLNSLYVYNARKLRKWLRNSDDKICPNPYWIGDIGTESDWERLIRKLWRKTEIAWQNYRQNNSHCSRK
ncbi:galactosyltransferase-like protein [Euroglyphus maynei]|uniref:Hexosyltransferase n=1 Tax=Euroglyphus maynei TaxID=6958 RepID=A0A1Y3BDL6_EURMA|nr:galactosyltransferase-like protein [Euroglyphus maynei]